MEDPNVYVRERYELLRWLNEQWSKIGEELAELVDVINIYKSMPNSRDVRVAIYNLEKKRAMRMELFQRSVFYMMPSGEASVKFMDWNKAVNAWLREPVRPVTDRKKAMAVLFGDELLSRAATYRDFLRYWALFFKNKVVIPTYTALWWTNDADARVFDDYEKMMKLGERLAALTLRGVFTTDSQTAQHPPNMQKAYVTGVAPVEFRQHIDSINRESGMFVVTRVVQPNEFIRWSHYESYTTVTWENGEIATALGGVKNILPLIKQDQVLHPNLRALFSEEDRWIHFNIIDTILGSDRILSMLEKYIPKTM